MLSSLGLPFQKVNSLKCLLTVCRTSGWCSPPGPRSPPHTPGCFHRSSSPGQASTDSTSPTWNNWIETLVWVHATLHHPVPATNRPHTYQVRVKQLTKVELNLHQAIPLLQSNEPVAYLMLLILSSEGKADAGICRGWACGHRQAVSLPSLSPNYKWPKHGVPEPGTGHLQYLTRSQSSMNMGYLNAWTL